MAVKIVVAPDKFKGTLDAQGVAESIARGVKRALPQGEIVLVPLADGGEGTVDAMLAAAGGVRHLVTVTGPLGEPVEAALGVLADGTAVIEMAQASGFLLISPARRNPLYTTTYGTGELIRAGLDLGCTRFIVGIGGSATCDAGVGMAQALGVRVLKADGSPIGFGGAELIKIAHIDASNLDARLRGAHIDVACDVTNPLYGPLGAAHVFAPQKGASPADVALLDQGLITFARAVERDLGVAVAELPGAGAAGGLGAGLVAFLGARLTPGVSLIMGAVGLQEKLAGAALLITGEGQLDRQSAFGKVPVGVARLGKAAGIPVVAIAGRLGDGYEEALACGIDTAYSVEELAGSLEEAMANPAPYIEAVAEAALKQFLA